MYEAAKKIERVFCWNYWSHGFYIFLYFSILFYQFSFSFLIDVSIIQSTKFLFQTIRLHASPDKIVFMSLLVSYYDNMCKLISHILL